MPRTVYHIFCDDSGMTGAGPSRGFGEGEDTPNLLVDTIVQSCVTRRVHSDLSNNVVVGYDCLSAYVVRYCDQDVQQLC